MYYLFHGYEPGLYKIEADGRMIPVVKDNIDQAMVTDTGMVYTKVYEEGIYTGK
jgi:hypothetical protein